VPPDDGIGIEIVTARRLDAPEDVLHVAFAAITHLIR
jgi:hypothetical protein